MSKAMLRRDLLDRRRHRTDLEREAAAQAIATHADAMAAVAGARVVAAYLSMADEPGTEPLVAALLRRKIKVIVPVVAEDRLLVWTRIGADTSIVPGPYGIPQPEGGKVASLDDAALAFVPALAVDHEGRRLGRGAGFYDRALAGTDVPTCAVVFADEVVPEVPAEPHDVPVSMALTPQGLIRFERPNL